jgi:hypothetical protein
MMDLTEADLKSTHLAISETGIHRVTLSPSPIARQRPKALGSDVEMSPLREKGFVGCTGVFLQDPGPKRGLRDHGSQAGKPASIRQKI